MAAVTSLKPFISSSLKLGDLTLKNRNIMASLTRNRAAPTNVPVHDAVREYYVQRARGGAGLILTEGVLIEQQGTEWPNAPGIWNEEHVQAWKKVTDAVHEAGSYIFCQLWHVGRVAHPDMPEQKAAGKPVPGPSPIAAQGGKFRQLPGEPGYAKPTEIKDPWVFVEKYRRAAELAKRAGFDGVELHSATGYLPNQFLDFSSNQRTDQWGGSVENRCRFGLECVKAMVDVWGPARVGIKISPCGGYNDVGMPLPDTIQTFTYYISQLASMKIAYVQFLRNFPLMEITVPVHPHVKNVNAPHPEQGFRRSTPHDVLAIYGGLVKPLPSVLEGHSEEAFRGAAMPKPEYDSKNPTPTRLFINAGVQPDEAESLIEKGVVDAAVFGMPWISNPDFQKRIERGLPLNMNVDFKTLYHGIDGDLRAGYTTYPEVEGATDSA